ncbi:hypothetical protein CKO23_22650 [Thiocystis violacea]|nr:hypothetical protein [Thiocystis violacea]
MQRARELRRAQTPAEAELWRQLRAKRFAGFKFRRQQPLGRYIVDFVCFEKKLIVELDGGQHAEAKDYDTARTQWLEQQGFRVLRFWNNEWTGQQEAVLETIYRALHAPLPPLPNPSPTRGEGLTAETPSTSPLALDTGEASPLSLDADEAPAPLSPGGRGAGGEGENGADLLQRILTERRARWEAKQLAKFKEKGKTPPKDWQKKYPEPVQPDTSGLPELPEGWVWASLDALIDEGPQNGLYLPGDRYGCGTPILRIDDYQIGWHRMRSELNLVDTDASTAALYALQPGDMVINRVNSMTHLGKSLSITHTLDGVLFESNMMRLRLSSELSLDYVSFYLGSHIGRARLIKDAKWAVNQASINQKDVRRTPVPLPPISEQVTIATMLQAQHGAVTSQAAAIEHALKQSTAQRQNILRAAFSGQLVPQDPNDEPASVLLERIRAEREARGAVKKPRRRNARESA